MKQVAIVGVGLIGGSIGAALRGLEFCDKVVGVGRNLQRLEKACQSGLIDSFSDDLANTAQDSDLVIICTPVETIVDFAITALNASEKVIVTDAGSTKLVITNQMQSKLAGEPGKLSRFVGSHPIAGSDQSGFESAADDLFRDRLVVLTPTESTSKDTTRVVTEFWKMLEASIELQLPLEHDQAMASISHLPHLIAAALAAATPKSQLTLAGTGFTDTTRVASGNVELWRQIFAQNKQPLLESLKQFESTLATLKQAIVDDDDKTLSTILEKGKMNRDSLGN